VGELLEAIDEHLAAWIKRQPMFFVGTAPLSSDGHVNGSPKGPIGTLAVLGPRRLAYLDFAGSGAETLAHLRENGRIVLMLCAFEGPPRIVRFHGRGRPVWPANPEFDALLGAAGFVGLTDVVESQRAVIDVQVTRIATSCGWGVPMMEHVGERPHYDLSRRKRLRTMGSAALIAHEAERHISSLDGLPAVPTDYATRTSCETDR
jgi:hypothetical protein